MKGFHSRFTHTPPEDAPGEVDTERVREALAFLDQHPDDPFFLWLHLEDPHIPCLPKPADAPAWEIPGLADPGAADPLRRFQVAASGLEARDPQVKAAAIRYLNAAYTVEVRYVDACVGKVLDHLRRLGREKNTIVLVHADHGMHAGGDRIGGRDFQGGTIR
ncbi:MAG: sulfatase-like hydrolase/transferase, partial [bacterium]|nr:sulfatase-like hydrolase/transferase [bacterium]